ncbi:hypothetical protein AVEN_209319-1 [Araneus ventricosus]|uniref:Uncharacterized protein n=1 Tax=Araneus ventricosus TaxID=182803 RepID=A0A4Y2CBB1_ARAVE|nr:hypothetical protein AVEN_209319-1 [Araneus ventricosus]
MELQWKQVSNLETLRNEVKTLPLGHRGPNRVLVSGSDDLINGTRNDPFEKNLYFHGQNSTVCRLPVSEIETQTALTNQASNSMKYHFRLMEGWEDKERDRKKMGLPTALSG